MFTSCGSRAARPRSKLLSFLYMDITFGLDLTLLQSMLFQNTKLHWNFLCKLMFKIKTLHFVLSYCLFKLVDNTGILKLQRVFCEGS